MSEVKKWSYGLDPVTIRHYGDGIKGGKVLDVTNFTDDVIQCGHVIIKQTSNGVYKPMPVSGGAYASLPSGHEFVGICTSTADTETPFVGVLTDGEVNDKTLPYPITPILTAFKAAVPTIRFDHD